MFLKNASAGLDVADVPLKSRVASPGPRCRQGRSAGAFQGAQGRRRLEQHRTGVSTQAVEALEEHREEVKLRISIKSHFNFSSRLRCPARPLLHPLPPPPTTTLTSTPPQPLCFFPRARGSWLSPIGKDSGRLYSRGAAFTLV